MSIKSVNSPTSAKDVSLFAHQPQNSTPGVAFTWATLKTGDSNNNNRRNASSATNTASSRHAAAAREGQKREKRANSPTQAMPPAPSSSGSHPVSKQHENTPGDVKYQPGRGEPKGSRHSQPPPSTYDSRECWFSRRLRVLDDPTGKEPPHLLFLKRAERTNWTRAQIIELCFTEDSCRRVNRNRWWVINRSPTFAWTRRMEPPFSSTDFKNGVLPTRNLRTNSDQSGQERPPDRARSHQNKPLRGVRLFNASSNLRRECCAEKK